MAVISLALSIIGFISVFKSISGSSGAGGASKGTGKTGFKSIDDLPANVQNSYNQYNKSGWKGNVSGQSAGTKAGEGYQNSNGALPTTDGAAKFCKSRVGGVGNGK